MSMKRGLEGVPVPFVSFARLRSQFKAGDRK